MDLSHPSYIALSAKWSAGLLVWGLSNHDHDFEKQTLTCQIRTDRMSKSYSFHSARYMLDLWIWGKEFCRFCKYNICIYLHGILSQLFDTSTESRGAYWPWRVIPTTPSRGSQSQTNGFLRLFRKKTPRFAEDHFDMFPWGTPKLGNQLAFAVFLSLSLGPKNGTPQKNNNIKENPPKIFVNWTFCPFFGGFPISNSRNHGEKRAKFSSQRPLRCHQHSAPCAHTTEDHRLGAVTLRKSLWKAGRRVDGLRGILLMKWIEVKRKFGKAIKSSISNWITIMQ